MRRTETVNLVEGRTLTVVEARLIEGLSRDEVMEAEAAWQPFQEAVIADMVAQGNPRPEQSHWDWKRKADAAPDDAVFFGAECDGTMQGMMITLPGRPSRLLTGETLIYVDYIATAPWNNRRLNPVPRYKQVGTVLIGAALRFSVRNGTDGRLGLHSLPQSQDFYGGALRMADLGVDESYYGLRYFEMTAEQGLEKGLAEHKMSNLDAEWLIEQAKRQDEMEIDDPAPYIPEAMWHFIYRQNLRAKNQEIAELKRALANGHVEQGNGTHAASANGTSEKGTTAALWGGRFATPMDALVFKFNQSLPFDRRLWREDITGSIAHAKMLARQGIIAADEGEAIVAGLIALRDDLQEGRASLPDDAEDIHSAVEGMLKERIGAVAGKLHTARSRNDQIATDIRLWLKGAAPTLRSELTALRARLVELAEIHLGVVLPGRTHHQHAQPVLLSHHLLAYFWMLTRDEGRLADTMARGDALPLGAGALAGTPFPIDREFVRQELGFAALCENSLDAVADRDFAIEFTSSAGILMMHLSRLAEELVLWSAPEFGFVELADSMTTGSSIMPQKKNPDVAELIRGKTGRVYGDIITLLTLMKGLVLTYNKDMQEDKEPLFDAFDTVLACVTLMTRLLEGAAFKPERMAAAMRGDFSTATDLADALAATGVPFREAHDVVGRLVRACIGEGRVLEDLSLDDLKRFDSRFTETALLAVQPIASANARQSRGGTATEAVVEQIARARRVLIGVP